MQKITPFFWFNDRGEEAAKFYVSVFKRAKIRRRSYYTEGSPAPAGSLLTIEFELLSQRFVILNAGRPRHRSARQCLDVSRSDALRPAD